MTRDELLSRLSATEAQRLETLAQLVALEVAPLLHEPPDQLLTVNEAAALLAVTTDWLYRHAGDFTFTVRPGPGQVRFSSIGIQDYLRKKRR